eukprot:7262704-Alexandrium_andersonii.AAC.1
MGGHDHFSPADLFRLLLAWAETSLRTRLNQRADGGYRYCIFISVALVLAQMRRLLADPRNCWTRDLTEDGDVEDNPGPRRTTTARRQRGRAGMDHLRPGSGPLREPEGTTG